MFKKIVFFFCLSWHLSLSAQMLDDLPVASYGNGFINSTYLIDITQGTRMSKKIADVRYNSFETALGREVKFYDWYKTNWIDSSVSFVTQINRDTGIVWGVSTGEYGEKYYINPSISLGLIRQFSIGKNTKITLQSSYMFFGKLKEKSCIADYGEVGGILKVNCRLAATEIPPKETLKYSLTETPKDFNFSFKIEHNF